MKYPVLRLCDPKKEKQVHNDASLLGSSAVLLQTKEDGGLTPVAYFKQYPNQAERNYHSFELETVGDADGRERGWAFPCVLIWFAFFSIYGS